MAPADVLERAGQVRNLVSERPRISVTELSRGKDWRDRLPQVGVIEITDRGDTAGWLLSPEDMSALIEGYAYLEEEAERAQIAALFEARSSSKPISGDELRKGVVDAFQSRHAQLKGVIDGD